MEASALARRIATEAHSAPDRFGDFAATYSEDVPTRQTSGSLGGVNAVDFLSTPAILDALAKLRPGEVSDVVETRCGFHILLRHEPPPDQLVSGAHIVVGHRNARWLHRFGSDRAIPDRSREEALGLANEIYSQARDAPERFVHYVQQYSEHRDAAQGGDLGEWSTREVPRMARHVDVLAKLAAWAVAAPVETFYGFEILMRTPNKPRKHYAMDSIQIRFDGEAPEKSPSSRASAWNRASEIAASLKGDSAQWASFQTMNCCPGIEVWSQGRSSAELEARLDALQVGETMTHTVQSHSGFVIAKRVAPNQYPPPAPVRLELPAPDVPDILYLAGQVNPETIQRGLRELSMRMVALLRLSGQEEARFKAMHELGSSFVGSSSSTQRRHVFAEFQKAVERSLGLTSTQLESYRGGLGKTFEDLALSPPKLKHPNSQENQSNISIAGG